MDKVFGMVLIFLSCLVTLDTRVEQWFMYLVLVQVTVALLRISAPWRVWNNLDGLLLIREDILIIEKGDIQLLSKRFIEV